jgi:hypothetical protein
MKSIQINWLKNILILALAVLCVYQTGRLWFDELPRLDDFLNLLGIERAQRGYGAALDGLARPKRILASEDGAVFVCNYAGVEQTEHYRTARLAILSALASGEINNIVNSEQIDFAAYLYGLADGETLIFDYGFNMPADAFTAAFGSRSNVLSGIMSYIDMVIFIPLNNESTSVIFVDSLSEVQTACELIVTGGEPVTFGGLPNRHNLVYILQPPQNSVMRGLTFMPQSLPGGISYAQIRQREVQNARNFLPLFLDSPDFARSEPYFAGHRFVASDETISLTMGFYLNYQNWLARRVRSTDSFASAYATAIMFMQRDSELRNDIYLHYYEYDSGTYIFHFNYVFNDFPVFISSNLKNALDSMDACIEITVEKGRVSRYRRYVVRLEELRVTDRHEISAERALRGLQIYFWGHDYELRVDYMDLAYYIDATGTVTGLSFNIYFDGEFVPVPVMN